MQSEENSVETEFGMEWAQLQNDPAGSEDSKPPGKAQPEILVST